MIDTVCLLIPRENVIEAEDNPDGSPNWDVKISKQGWQRYVKTPPKKLIDEGYYFPKVTFYKRNFSQDANMRVEFSAPKIVFGNNLDELSDNAFPIVVEALQNRLEMMGIKVDRETVENSAVSSVHYSKNIRLTGGYTSTYIIGELSKINVDIELEEHTQADYEYHTTVSSVLSVARRAKSIFDGSETHEKRAFLNYLIQNPVVEGKNLYFTLRKPFNLVLEVADNPNWLRR